MTEPLASSSPPENHPSRTAPLRNVLSNWGGFGVAVVVNLALAPFVVRKLGDTQYGVWVLLASLVGYLGLLDLGVRAAVTRYVANLHARAEHAEAGRLASAALGLFAVVGLVAVAAATVMAWVAPLVLNIPPDLVPVARWVFVIGGWTTAVTLVGGVFGGIVVGLQRFDLSNAVGVTTTLVRAALVVAALQLGKGLVGLAVVQLGISAASSATYYVLSRRLYPALHVHPARWHRADLSRVFTYGMSATLLQVSVAVMTYTSSLVIGAFLPVAAITFFAIAANLTEYVRQIVSGISYTVTPMASAVQARGTPADLQKILLRASRLATLVVLPIVITFIVRGASFIELWMGPAYAGPSGAVLTVLAIALWPLAAYQVLTSMVMGMDRHRGLIPVYVVEAAVNVGLSVLLVRRYGIVGVAWATALPRFAACFLCGPWYAERVVGARTAAYWYQTWLLPWLGMVPFAAGTWVVESFWPAGTLAVFFAQVGLTLPVAVVGAWRVALSEEDRQVWTRSCWRPIQQLLGRP